MEGGDEGVVICSKSQLSKVNFMVITTICGILSIDDWPCHTGENQTQYKRTFDFTSHTLIDVRLNVIKFGAEFVECIYCEG